MRTDWAWYRDITHALGCACGINDAGQRYIDLICRPQDGQAVAKCTYGGDCTVHPDVQALHNFDPMLPPGGETHIEYGVESIDTEIAGFQLVGTDASAQRFSTHQRSHTVWPDGAKYVTGWKKKQ